jgi:hypothetical protein
MKQVLFILFLGISFCQLAQQKADYRNWKLDGNCDTLYHYLQLDTTIMATDLYKRTHIHDFTLSASPCRKKALEILVARGVDINAQDWEKHTALDLAVNQKDAEIIIQLRGMGAEMNTTNKTSPLYKAIVANDIPEIGKLCRRKHLHEGFSNAFGWNMIFLGPRVNYMPGNKSFIGIACPVNFQSVDYILNSHFGLAVGMDIKLRKELLLAPKISVEYRYQLFLARMGYLYYTDLEAHDHAVFGEVGISVMSFIDLTYVHVFHDRNPFDLGADYFNLTLTLGLSIYDRSAAASARQ